MGVVIVVGLALLALLQFMPLNMQGARFLQEKIELSLQPTAARAYGFGLGHFSSSDTAAHNVDYAEYFFRRAIALDPAYPFAHQQLARILFLRADFTDAITEINAEIALQGDANPSAFYIRGLIEGYQGSYGSASKDYEHFLSLKPDSWAGYNDYAWVLLKSKQFHTAAKALGKGLRQFPGNPWLLNSFATALYEIGDVPGAKIAGQQALTAASALTESDWIKAYPGNDPRIAATGLATFKNAVRDNLAMIMDAGATSTR